VSGGRVLRQEVIFVVQDDGPVGLDLVRVVFDDRRAVADAGILLCASLAARLGIEALVARFVRLGPRMGAANAGCKVMTLISAMLLGADSIDDCDILRSGRTGALLGHRVAAPSTLGTFLRAFSFGHVRQLDRVLAEALKRAWAAGAGPGDGRLVVDVDSFTVRSMATPSKGRGSATPVGGDITRCSPPGPTPARCCTSGCARGRRAARAACCASPRN
jgi:hypothetical protein